MRVFDLGQAREDGATAAQQLGKAADAVEFIMRKKEPLGLIRAGGDMAEPDADVLIEFLGSGEPCCDGVERIFGHILEIVKVLEPMVNQTTAQAAGKTKRFLCQKADRWAELLGHLGCF